MTQVMRTHRTTLHIPVVPLDWNHSTAKQARASWSQYVALCQSLATDGFDCTVTVNRLGTAHDGHDVLRLTVEGTAARAGVVKHKPRKRAFTLPAKLTAEQCQKRAIVAQKGIESDHYFYAQTIKFETPAWRAFDIALRAAVDAGGLDGALRSDLANAWRELSDPEIYSHDGILRTILHSNLPAILWELSYTADTPYRSMKCSNPGDHFRYGSENVKVAARWFARDTAIDDANSSAAHCFMAQFSDLRQAETEYWRELEMLSGQRERFAPGVADTLDTSDELEVAA